MRQMIRLLVLFVIDLAVMFLIGLDHKSWSTLSFWQLASVIVLMIVNFYEWLLYLISK